MEQEKVLEIFRSSGALLEGHFQLTSGYHSNRYFQCAKVLQHPAHTTALCGDLAARFDPSAIDVVIAPAMGGIIVAQEIGRQLNRRTLFTERKDGVMQLRRGFEIARGERVLVCEDVVTTGGSVNEVIEIVKEMGGIVAGVAYIVDRSNGTVKFAVDAGGKQVPLMVMDVVKYDPASCPLCAQGLPVVKPGSRPGK
jgi:orotate phosphoribosyltransferase